MAPPPRNVRLLLAVAIACILGCLVLFVGLRGRSGWDPAVSASARPSGSPGAPRSLRARQPGVNGAAGDHRGPLRLPSGEIAADAARKAGAFSGRVVSERGGEPIGGATLTFDHEDETLTVSAGADGAFLLEPPEPGVYVLALVTAQGFHPFAPAWGESPVTLVARAGEVVRGLTVTLSPEARYEGVVLTPGGEPAAGAEVRILDAPEGAVGARFMADDKGAFTFTAPDEALLEASHPAYAPGRGRVDLRVQAGRRITLRLGAKGEERAGQTIAGTVVDASGAPVVGAAVRAGWSGDPGVLGADLHPGDEVTTDADGAFLLEGLDAGRYALTAREGTRAAYLDEVAGGAREVTLRLGGTGRLRGVVRSAGGERGELVKAFSVLVALHRGPLERETAAAASFFDASGAYAFEDLLPGTYAVTAAAMGHASSKTVTVTVQAGGEATADLVLGRGGNLHGLVVEEGTGTPLAGARVTVEGGLGPGAGPVPVVAEATTDPAGRFSLAGLSEGLRSVAAMASGHHGRILSGLVIAEGGTLGPVTISLTPLQEGEEPRIEMTGIGAVLSAKDDALVVGQVMAGGGAAAAGLGPGDAIVAIDGVRVVDLGFEGAIGRIRGPEGSTVALLVRRGNAGAPVNVLVQRTRVRG